MIITDGLWGFIGVVIGSIITYAFQYIFELHREKESNRKIFLKQYYQMENNIFLIKHAIKNFNNFLSMDIKKYKFDELNEELIPSINNFSNQCSKIWSGFRIIILSYFYKSIDSKSFHILDNTVTEIINMNIGKYCGFEILVNNHDRFQNCKYKFIQSIEIIEKIENEYYKLEKKILRKKI